MYPISSFLAINLITLLTAGLPHLLSQPPPPISHWRGVFSSLCIAPTPREQLHPSLSLSCPESAGRQFPYHSCKELQPSALQMVSMLEAVPHCLGKPLQQAISGNDTLLFCGLHNHRLENSPGKSYYPLKACRLFAVKSSSNFGQQFIIIIFFFYKVNRPTNISPAEQWYFTLRTHWFFIATYQSQYLKEELHLFTKTPRMKPVIVWSANSINTYAITTETTCQGAFSAIDRFSITYWTWFKLSRTIYICSHAL